MWTPTVRQEDAEKFKQMMLEKYGKELTDLEALDGANRLVQIYFWKTYGNEVLKKEIFKKRHPDWNWEENNDADAIRS
jgi:hypothetical protein